PTHSRSRGCSPKPEASSAPLACPTSLYWARNRVGAGHVDKSKGWGLQAAMAALLVAGLLAVAGCQRNEGGQLPAVSGEAIRGEREAIEGFGLVRAWPDQADESLAIALEFSQPLVGTQDFDKLLSFA